MLARARRFLGVVKRRAVDALLGAAGWIGRPLASPGKKVWLFGAWEGKRYGDNARYLYSYVRERFPQIEAVWISENRATLREAARSGGKAVRKGSWRALAYESKAEAMFYTTSAHDVTSRRLPGVLRVNLWHGMPLKKIGLDWKQPYSWGPHDATLATAAEFVGPLAGGLGLAPENVWVTGLPRNDALFRAGSRDRVLKELGLPAEGRVVLYLPTWRKQEHSFSRERAWDAMTAHAGLTAALLRHGAFLVVKGHPIDSARLANPSAASPFRVVGTDVQADPQDLLQAADALVTDYSSSYVDYLLLDRPIVFYCPDLEEYRRDPGFYFPYEEATPGAKAATIDELARCVDAAFSRPREHQAERAAAVRRFHRHVDGESCRRVVERVLLAVRGERR